MAIRIKSQKDYLLTEVCIEPPVNLAEIDDLMKRSRGTGKLVVQYNGGGVLGVNVEQRSKIPLAISDKVRGLIGVDTTEINGDD